MRIIKEIKDFFISTARTGLFETITVYLKIIVIYFWPFKKPLAYLTKWNAAMMLKEVFLSKDYFFNSKSDSDLFIVDGGGNIGISTLFFKKVYPQAEVNVFEPDEITRSILEKNVKHLPKVTVYPYAMSDTDGMVDFFHSDINPGGSSLYPKDSDIKTRNRMTVECRKLSTFITRPVFILKLDIEGAELSVLKDLKQTGKLRMIANIALEYHYNITNNALSNILSILESEGYLVKIGSSIFDHRQFYHSSYILRATRQ